MRVALVGPTNQSRSVITAPSRTINWIPEIDPKGKYPMRLVPRPGENTFASPPAGQGRGCKVFGGRLIEVVGASVVSVDTAGVVTNLGTINTSSGPVVMVAGRTHVAFVDGQDGWTYNGSALAQITDADFPSGATHIGYLDGKYIANNPANPGQFNYSDDDDPTAWNGASFATAERDPDALLAVVINKREIWLFGSQSAEPWYSNGAADLPFAPDPSGFVEWGIQAPYSAATIDGSVYWLATSEKGGGMVMKSQGPSAARISTDAIEDQIRALGTTDDAIAWSMALGGHLLYLLTFPTGDLTLVYDASTDLWHEWKTYGSGRFHGNAYAFFNGNHVIADHEDGTLYTLDYDAYSDAGTVIERKRRHGPMTDSENHFFLFHRALEVELEMGVGTASLDPQVLLRYSNDGGRTFAGALPRTLGYVGDYKHRAKWQRLGRARDRVYEIEITDAVKAVLVGAYADVDVGTA